MDNPSLILQTVDKYLNHGVSLVLYGRSAIYLGFNSPPMEAANTKDVDCIISTVQAQALEGDPNVWDAIEAANNELAEKGLYITHLFSEAEISFVRAGSNIS